MGSAVGFVVSSLVIIIERSMRRISTRNLSAAVFGLLFGIFMAWIMTGVLKLIPMDENINVSLQITMILIFCYLGMTIAIRGKDEFNIIIPYVKFANIGIAPYKYRVGAEYLAHTSNQMIQYTYCRLPIVAPDFVAGHSPHVLGYVSDDVTAIRAAMTSANA